MKTVLKWAGSKVRIIEKLKRHLPAGQRLVEPFAGSCAVMMNTDYDKYLIADINPDLIYLYKAISLDVEQFIADAKRYFEVGNSAETYYNLRADFNVCADWYWRGVLFLYLNRHCYNGLCRYNQSGGFNVPFGKYKAPYFPEAEIRAFAEKAKKATFVCCSYSEALAMVRPGDVVYCDPPYLPASKSADFSSYHSGPFGMSEHLYLKTILRRLAERSYPVVVSNSDTPKSRALFCEFNLTSITAPRSIGAAADSIKSAPEIIAKLVPANPEYLPPAPNVDGPLVEGMLAREEETTYE
ncbi:Dam family site-specific DNA-(adenine-N6)-methyltransferase [Ewingella sp. AOP9-I1-14]